MTKSLEDYIETIYVLIKEKGAARVRDVAADLHVKMPSVVKAMAELKKLELVIQEPYGDIELTAKGRKVATGVLTRHTILKAFLLKLGVTEQVADNDACLMEHILSAQTMDRIRDFLGKTPALPDAPAKKTANKAKKETK
jgi:DtxR family Mn-dependent transcriptional regulator